MDENSRTAEQNLVGSTQLPREGGEPAATETPSQKLFVKNTHPNFFGSSQAGLIGGQKRSLFPRAGAQTSSHTKLGSLLCVVLETLVKINPCYSTPLLVWVRKQSKIFVTFHFSQLFLYFFVVNWRECV